MTKIFKPHIGDHNKVRLHKKLKHKLNNLLSLSNHHIKILEIYRGLYNQALIGWEEIKLYLATETSSIALLWSDVDFSTVIST